jgi:hypothetical protein
MPDEQNKPVPETEPEAPATPMNRAERRAAAHHKSAAHGHPSTGRQHGFAGPFHAGQSGAAPTKHGKAHRKTG